MTRSPAGAARGADSTDWSALWFAQDAAARLIVARDLTVRAANPNALALIDNNNALQLRDGALTIRDRRALAELTAVVTGARPDARCVVVGATVLVDVFALGRDPKSAVADFLAGCRNDLEAPAIALQPAIAEVLTALRAAPETLIARMSGSGATCFALCADQAAARRLASSIASAHPGWWVQPCRLAGLGEAGPMVS